MDTESATWHLSCTVNGESVEEVVEPQTTLLSFLRDRLLLTGTKGACLEGECGSCTVLVNGKPVNSCLMLAAQAQGSEIRTIEGVGGDGRLDVLQRHFLATGAVQCGYCTPGLIMAAKALWDVNPNPTEDELVTAIEANICRCTGYESILRAVRGAYQELQA
jgi:carbon-monoxide dehydrogenase small subunit